MRRQRVAVAVRLPHHPVADDPDPDLGPRHRRAGVTAPPAPAVQRRPATRVASSATVRAATASAPCAPSHSAPRTARGKGLGLARHRAAKDLFAGRVPHERDPLVAVGAPHLQPARVRVGESPAQRDRSPPSRPTGRQDRRARPGRRRARGSTARPGGRCRHPLELLTQQPARLVELVHPHVHGDPAAVGAELLGRQLVRPTACRQLADLPQPAAAIRSRSSRSSGTNRRQ